MAILYGTETGNSEEIAKELGDLAERLHFRTIVDEMNNFTLVCLPSIVLPPRGAGSVICWTDEPNAERSGPLRFSNICSFHHWPRGHASQFDRALEKSVTEETAAWLFGQRQVHHLRSWRQLLSKV